MTNKEYREKPGVSRSELWQMSRSPFHYKYGREHPAEETPALQFGSAQHKAVLEPDEFFDEYAILPGDIDKRTKEGKAKFASFQLLVGDRTVITEKEYEQISEMVEALKQNETAWQLVSGGKHEQSYFWTDPDTGLACKVRPDVVTEWNGKPYLVDYKTTDSCADGHFERSCERYGYKLQAGMYTEGMLQTEFKEYGFAFVAQEKTPPYAARVYDCKEDFIKEGYDLFREYIGTLKYCEDTGDWFGYEGQEHMVSSLGGDGDD